MKQLMKIHNNIGYSDHIQGTDSAKIAISEGATVIEKHFKLGDDEFEKAFETCTLDPLLFTHEAHLRLAHIHIQKYGRLNAIENIRYQLKNYLPQWEEVIRDWN